MDLEDFIILNENHRDYGKNTILKYNKYCIVLTRMDFSRHTFYTIHLNLVIIL